MKKIVKIFLQSIIYLGSISLMIYIGYSKHKDKDWSLLKQIHPNETDSTEEHSVKNPDSSNFVISQIAYEDQIRYFMNRR